MTKQIRTPDWKYWRKVQNDEVWKLVTLSLNLEPRDFWGEGSFEYIAKNHAADPDFKQLIVRVEDYSERLKIVKANLGKGLQVVTRNISSVACSKVRLSDFANWVTSKAWEIPAELTNMALDKPKKQQSKITQQSQGYSTPWFKVQNAAVVEFFNPRRNPDAKRDEVVEWIKLSALKAGLPDSQNVASAIFTIIKPENHDPKKKRVEPKG